MLVVLLSTVVVVSLSLSFFYLEHALKGAKDKRKMYAYRTGMGRIILRPNPNLSGARRMPHLDEPESQ